MLYIKTDAVYMSCVRGRTVVFISKSRRGTWETHLPGWIVCIVTSVTKALLAIKQIYDDIAHHFRIPDITDNISTRRDSRLLRRTHLYTLIDRRHCVHINNTMQQDNRAKNTQRNHQKPKKHKELLRVMHVWQKTANYNISRAHMQGCRFDIVQPCCVDCGCANVASGGLDVIITTMSSLFSTGGARWLLDDDMSCRPS